MKNFLFLSPVLFFIFSCNGDGVKNNMPDPDDTTGQVKQPVDPPKPRRDSFLLDNSKSSFACTRSKTVKDVDKQIKIGNSTMNLKMDNASFSANTDIKIKNGWWFSLDKKSDGGKVVLDMKSVAALQIGEDEKLETGNPGYLESKKYPTSTLTILHIDSIPGNAKKMNVVCSLQIKDTTGSVTFPAKVEYANAAHPEAPTKLTGDFHIDGIKWALNPKNAKVTKDDLAFHVVLVFDTVSK
jgi:hypothetical protein